jgi:hypothetical protein
VVDGQEASRRPASSKRKRKSKRKKKEVTLSARVLAFLGAVILAIGTAIGGALGDVLKDVFADAFQGPPKTDVAVKDIQLERGVSRDQYVAAVQGVVSRGRGSESFPRLTIDRGMVVYAQVDTTGYEGVELEAIARVFNKDQERITETDGVPRRFLPFSDDDSRTIDVWVAMPSTPGEYTVELSVFRTGDTRHRVGSGRHKFSVRAP